MISVNSYSQEVEISNLQWGKKVVANEDIVIVSGMNYKEDGYGTSVSLVCFDLQLKKIWELNFNKEQTNTIDVLTFWNDKIIVSGTQGEKANQYSNTNRFIKVLSLNGDSLAEINIGSSTGKSTNFIIDNNHLLLGYKKSSSIYYSDMMQTSKNAVVKINLTNMSYSISEHYLSRSTPEIILFKDKNLFICGEQYKNEKYNVTETFFHNINSESSIKNILPAETMEGLGSGIVTKIGFTLLSYSNPFIANQDRYIRLDYLDPLGELLNTKILLFKDLGWTHIDLNIPSIENEFWLYVIKEDQKSYYVQLDSEGREINSIKSDTESATSTDFAINSKKIIHLIREEDKVKLKIVAK